MKDDVQIQSFLRTLAPGHKPNIDIIAVHGLNPKNKKSHAERTWEAGGKLWLRDFLPKQLPRARILLFGYNSNVGIQSSSAGVREQAQILVSRIWLERQACEDRPILFIAHSLGGIVVKEALVQAKLGEKYGSICTATYGIAFFGTPHRGSSWAGIGDIFAKVARAVLRNPSNTFLNALKRGDLYASELAANFEQLQESYKYLNVYETVPLKKIGLIVEKSSATLGLPDSRETKVALNADHEMICRFASEDDESYKHISSLIVDLASSAVITEKGVSRQGAFSSTVSTLVESTLVTDAPEETFFIVPYSRNSGFIDRKPVIKQLKDRITPIGNSHSRVALFGLGGVGKSQVAIEFVYRMCAENTQLSVFWVHASNIDRFREGYYSIAKECDIPTNNEKRDRMLVVKDWLEKSHKEWLMVIDNADEASLFVSSGGTSPSTADSIVDYLPECSNGSILVTTRNRAAGVKFTRSQASNMIEVKTMTEVESKCLIESNLTEHIPTDSEIQELAEMLDHLPLALAQASAFMQENALSISEYIELYKESDETRMDLLCESFETLGRDTKVPNAVATTLSVSINQIENRDPRAIEMFSLIALVDRHDIPKSLIQHKVKRLLDFTKALGILKSFSLISTNEDRASLSLHRLVQLVMRKWMILEAKFEIRAIEALGVLAELFPDATFENRNTCAIYLPHAQSVLGLVPGVQGPLLRQKIYLQEGIAWYLWTQGHYNDAECLDTLVLGENKQQFGTEHPETLESIGNLSATYESQGKWAEAEELDRFLVDMYERLYGPKNNHVLNSMANLARTYRHQGRLEEAKALVLEVLEKRKSVFGADSEEVMTSMSNLGLIYIDQHRLEEAEEVTLQAWNFRKQTYGANHAYTLENATTLGKIYAAQSRLDEAFELTHYTLLTKETILGPKHPSTVNSRTDLASIYQKQKEWRKAEELMLQVISEETERLGSAHYDVLVSKQKLSSIYWDEGRVDMADKLEGEILRGSVSNLGPDHRFTLECMHDIAITQKALARNEEAIQLMVHVTNLQEKRLGPYHDDTLDSLGILCSWCGDEDALNKLVDAGEKEEGDVDSLEHILNAITA